MDRFTTTQLADLMALREEWRQIALRTRPADRPRAERGIELAYQEAGLEPPQSVRWVDSPVSGAIDAHVAKDERSRFVAPVLRYTMNVTLNNLRAQVRARVIGEVSALLWNYAEEVALEADSVFRPAIANVAFITTSGYICGGQYDAGLGFYADACHRVLGLSSKLVGLREVVRSAGIYWPLRTRAIMVERPVRLHRQDRRLHCTDGPAVEWTGGYVVYALTGRVVSRQVVESPESLTARSVLNERDPVVRRLMVARMGVALLMQRAEAERLCAVIDSQGLKGEANHKRLLRLGFPDDEALTVLVCTDATPRPDGTHESYWLRVPPDKRTCLEAVAWTFNKTPEEYQQMALET